MILVLGKNGMLGRYVYDYLCKQYGINHVYGTDRKSFDITEVDNLQTSLYNLLSSYSTPLTVVNCIGVINKRTDVNNGNMYMVNAIFPHILSRLCIELEANLIHISTDCVFSGEIGMYRPFDEPDDLSHYGLSKSIGEHIQASVIRCSIIGEEISRKTGLLEWCKENRNKDVLGYTNHYWNGITCLECAKKIYTIISKNDYWIGIRHFTSLFRGAKMISKYDLVKCINDVYGLEMRITPHRHTEDINRTLYEDSISPLTPDLKDQIIQMKEYIFI